MHFVAMIVRVRPREQVAPLTVADGVYAHAAILHAIGDQDLALAQALHDLQRHKQMALAIVHSNEQFSLLRLAFMNAEGLVYANAVLNRLATQQTIRLGTITCDVESVDLANSDWTGVRTWQDIVAGSSGRYIRFEFITPTAITKWSREGYRFTALLPEPLDIFAGLSRRWQALQGPALPNGLQSFLKSGGCRVSNYGLQTEKFYAARHYQIGFTGWVVYECLQGQEVQIAALNALARLAFFTGVGYQTARGMGAVRTTISN